MTNYNKLNYSVRRNYVDSFFHHHVSSIPKNSQILDLGGNKTQKRGDFNIEKYALKVSYFNLSTVKQPDVQADAIHLPICDNSFDVVICAEVLEHLRSPIDVIREAYRVLRPSGTILVTVPFLFPIHSDPYDFGRYTDYYWLEIFRDTGFQDILIEKQGLYFSTLLNFTKLYLNKKVGRPFRWFLDWPTGKLQQAILRYEQQTTVQKDQFINSFTTGFGIRATTDKR